MVVSLPGTMTAGACRVPRAWSGDQPKVPIIGGQGGPDRAGPAEPLEPGRDLGVIQVRMVAAVAADELEQPGAAAVWGNLAGAWLAPQRRHHAVAKLARRDCEGTGRFTAPLAAAGIVATLAGNFAPPASRPVTGRGTAICWTHPPTPGPVVPRAVLAAGHPTPQRAVPR